MCIEHELSVIQNPKQHSKGRFLHYGQWIGEKPPSAQQRVRLAIVEALGQRPADFPAFLRLMEESGFAVKHGRGGVISFLAPGQDKYTRLRASVLGPGFDPDDIRAVIAGERPIPELPKDSPAPPRRVNLIIDIGERMAQGKGPAYARWAKVYNLKQMAAALQYLQEHKLTDYEELAASTEAAVDRFHALAGELRETEAALSHTIQLMGATVDFAKTRPVFDGYKAARYSKKYLAQHEAELDAYRAAKAAMNDLLGGAKLPKMDALKKERRELSEKISECGHTRIACRFVQAPEMAQKTEARTSLYASSVSRAFCSPSAVYFITVSSFSSIELSMTSICFRQVLSPLSLSGKKN